MKIKSVHLIVPAFLLTVTCIKAAGQQFPVIQPGQTSYTISPAEASGLVINTLYLPDGFTLKVDPSVKSVDWIVDKIVIGVGATIDLSAPQTKPARAPNGVAPPPQASWCATGATGAAGDKGVAGLSGVKLTIHNVGSIDNHGSLWIKSDGGPGGDGGNGGNGQQGGGRRSVVGGGGPFFHGGGCNAAGGGAGGAGGSAGAGGQTSIVTISFQNAGAAPITNGGVSAQCGPSQRPASVQGATGVIVIWGAPGCPGASGSAGAHGIGG